MQQAGLITFVTKPPKELFTIGQRIAWARKERELSQAALALKVGVSQSAIGNFESGLRNKPRELSAIAAVLHVSLRWLERNEGPWEAGSAISESQPEEPWPYDRVDIRKLARLSGAPAKAMENAMLATAGDFGVDIRNRKAA